MRRLYVYVLMAVLTVVACEEVIDVDLDTAPTQLVVNGIIRVDESQEFVNTFITVAETSNFFSENMPAQLDGNATIFYGIPNGEGLTSFEEIFTSSLVELQPGSGVYVPDPNMAADQRIRTENVTPETVFVLFLTYGGRDFAALSPYLPTVPIDNLEQGDDTLFDGDETEVMVTLTDVENTEDYYVFDFGFSNFLALADLFFDGQQFEFSYFYDEQFDPGTTLEISVLGANLEFFNYMSLLVDQAERDGGGFEVPVATVRGNISEVTGLELEDLDRLDEIDPPENFAFGYFAVTQEFTTTVTIQ